MRTNKERTRLIIQRTAEIKRDNFKKTQRLIAATCAAACMVLIVAFGFFMPQVEIKNLEGKLYTSGAASIVASHDALGYIIMGLLSFLLGVCVTVFLLKFRTVCEHNREGKND